MLFSFLFVLPIACRPIRMASQGKFLETPSPSHRPACDHHYPFSSPNGLPASIILAPSPSTPSQPSTFHSDYWSSSLILDVAVLAATTSDRDKTRGNSTAARPYAARSKPTCLPSFTNQSTPHGSNRSLVSPTYQVLPIGERLAKRSLHLLSSLGTLADPGIWSRLNHLCCFRLLGS